jgi:hypothetical protein
MAVLEFHAESASLQRFLVLIIEIKMGNEKNTLVFEPASVTLCHLDRTHEKKLELRELGMGGPRPRLSSFHVFT